MVKIRYTHKYILAGLSFVCFALAYYIQTSVNTPDYKRVARVFERELHHKESQLDKLLEEINQLQDEISFNTARQQRNWFESIRSEGSFSAMVFEKDSLVLWTGNSVPLPEDYTPEDEKSGLRFLANGWYDVRVHNKGQRIAIGFILIKREYPFENRFLSNTFYRDFDIPQGGIFTEQQKPNGFLITSVDGLKFGYVNFDGGSSMSGLALFTFPWYLALLLILIAIVTAIVYLEHIILLLDDHFGKTLSVSVFVLSAVSLRVLMIWNKFPDLLYELPLFSPSYYGTSSIFPSLGDFFINGLIACSLAYYVKLKLDGQFIKFFNTGRVWVFVKLTAALLLAIPLKMLIEGLVINSSICYNVINLFELNYMSFVGLAAIGFFLFFYYFTVLAAVSNVVYIPAREFLINCILALVSFIVACTLLGQSDPYLLILPPVFAAILVIRNRREMQVSNASESDSSLYATIALIVVASVFTSHTINKSHVFKELEERKVLAQKLAVETDPVAEYMYGELEAGLLNDPVIAGQAGSDAVSAEMIIERMHDKHLRGYWEKYDVQITMCRTTDSLIIQDENTTVPCIDFFNDMIRTQGNKTMAHNFYYLENNNGRVSYLGILDNNDVSFFMEFDSKIIPEEMGFPELLLDMEVSEHLRDALKHYSYAKFKHGKLKSQSGDYPYSGRLTAQNADREYSVSVAEGYNHLLYRVDDSTTIILSRKQDQALDPVIRFSYLFAMFCIMALALGLLNQLPLRMDAIRLSFRKRIELSMILVLVISLIPIAIGTKYYIERQYQTRNDRNLREKIQSVLIEVEHKLANEEKLTGEIREYIAYLLQKFSYVFFTDINLYDLDGSLIASSRGKIFREGLIGNKMDAEAFAVLSVDAKSEFIHRENIGKLSFLSAYAHFRNKNQEVLAYLNLPYFAKQDDVKKEVSTFFVALFNIYVVLILIAVLIALIISNRITQPLRLIQEKLSKVKVGSANEPISWKSKDEIGSLVDQYNRMLKDLEISADLLAKSERESAWREMAKQVAHEIKNPLTPMKLSVQHLQRAWNDENVDWEKKLKQFTQTLIQQIDALSNIANEFSNFAKMPKTKSAVVDLSEIVENAVGLFNESGPVEISFSNNAGSGGEGLLVLADKEQLNQILNNLIKNALQAIPETEQGIVDVKITRDEHAYIVAVQDNGQGIRQEEFDKIFSPNFTTKTGGMGLGLALVKNMIENAGGSVWFESTENNGAVFYFSLPIHNP